MKRRFSAPAVSLVLMFLLALAVGPVAHAGSPGSAAPGVSFRPDRVRAFAPETPSMVVVREGRDRYLRLTLTADCPALASAQRLAFQVGPGLVAADQNGTLVPVVRQSAPAMLSAATPHAYVVTVAAEGRTTCRLADVTPADRAAFEAAAAVHGHRDNRYAGTGRPAG